MRVAENSINGRKTKQVQRRAARHGQLWRAQKQPGKPEIPWDKMNRIPLDKRSAPVPKHPRHSWGGSDRAALGDEPFILAEPVLLNSCFSGLLMGIKALKCKGLSD